MSKTKKILFIAIGCLLLTAGCWLYYDYQNKKFEVVFFKVGQGDSALINLPGNNEILIDGGPDMTVLYKLGKYLPVYDRSIELMILTHPHDDHLLGLIDVLKRYQVKKIMFTGVKLDSTPYEAFIKDIQGIKVIKVGAGDLSKINLDESNFLEIIYPTESLAGKDVKDLNSSSIVVRLVTKSGENFLFTGDTQAVVEKEILDRFSANLLRAQVLKVAHHGSDTSSSEKFIQAVNPSYAIISVGENKFGQPALRVIRRLERARAKVLRTDEAGDVRFKMNKEGKIIKK